MTVVNGSVAYDAERAAVDGPRHLHVVEVDHDADDVVQATWLAALRSPPRHGHEIRAWFATLLRNGVRQNQRLEARLTRDLRAICEHHIRFFGEPAPMDYYQFQVLLKPSPPDIMETYLESLRHLGVDPSVEKRNWKVLKPHATVAQTLDGTIYFTEPGATSFSVLRPQN